MQALGDSILDWNEELSTPDVLAEILKERGVSAQILNNAVSGATLGCGDNGYGDPDNCVPPQYVQGQWDYILMSGGANDIDLADCELSADTFVSPQLDAGYTVELIDGFVAAGSKVLLYSYFYPRDANHRFNSCTPIFTLMERYKALAKSRDDIILVDASSVISSADTEMYDEDGVHPSEKGSRKVAELIANVLGL